MFAGFGDEEDDEWDEEPMDLSGWMSRTEDLGGITDEPPLRPRSNPKVEPLDSETNPQMNFTPPMSNIGYVANPVSRLGPFNPLYADDQAVWGNPKIAVGAKVLGMGVFIATSIYALGKAIQYRSDRDVDGLGEGVRAALSDNYSIPGKAMVTGLALYLHPALGMAHGGLAKFGLNETGMSKHTVAKVAIHGLVIAPTFYFLKR
jgi:hypothetical protein